MTIQQPHDMTYQEGDVVRLKSGGPDMTVSYAGEVKFPHGKNTPTIQCKWFEGKKLHTAEFAPKLLEKVP